jgi:hypothetical protein
MEEDQRLRQRIATFVQETKTKKAVHLTMVTTYGLKPGGYSNDVQSQITMDDLFE